MLAGKKVLVGISGSIAAYKIPILVRLLIKAGAEVRVVMTKAATDFVSPLTLSTLTDYPVAVDFFDADAPEKGWNNHVEMGLWADYFIVAPTSSNTLSKMASGQSDSLLPAVFMSAKCPVYFAPAMDLDMYKNEATISNIRLLEERGYRCIPSESGELASGLVGEGRMAEPENIMTFLENDIRKRSPLFGKKVMLTAGPTHEAIDPVRFIGNHSTGKMGHALAVAARDLGADVHLILGPTQVSFNTQGIRVYNVVSASDMFDQAEKLFPDMDYAIFAAAVADYRPKHVQDKKIKKAHDVLTIELEKTVDILQTLAHRKSENQVVIGFALETHDQEENSLKKLHTKKADFIVSNTPGKGTGFGSDTNEVVLYTHNADAVRLSLKDKLQLANELWDYFINE
jgi:phosphopantothenoylcysteine decarboxylase/phosphopantothenate--cysteine ligase